VPLVKVVVVLVVETKVTEVDFAVAAPQLSAELFHEVVVVVVVVSVAVVVVAVVVVVVVVVDDVVVVVQKVIVDRIVLQKAFVFAAEVAVVVM